MKNPYDLIFKPKVTVLANGHSVTKKATRTPVVVVLILVAILVSVYVTGFNFSVLVKNGKEFWVLLKKMAQPDFKYAKNVWKPLLDTIQMSILGTFIGSILALPYSMLCASNTNGNKVVLQICRFIGSVLRTLPTLVIALIITLIFSLGTFAGTVAIAIYVFSIVSKMTYEQIETIDMGAYEAMESLGAGRVRAFIAAVLPYVMPAYLSNSLYCLESMIRRAAVLGYVGAGGIGLILNQCLALREYNKVGMILLILLVAVLVLETISRFCRKKLS